MSCVIMTSRWLLKVLRLKEAELPGTTRMALARLPCRPIGTRVMLSFISHTPVFLALQLEPGRTATPSTSGHLAKFSLHTETLLTSQDVVLTSCTWV